MEDSNLKAAGTTKIKGEETRVFVGAAEKDGTHYSVRAGVVDRGDDTYVLFVQQFKGSSLGMAEVDEGVFERYLDSVRWVD
ncbi:MAG: hypothetical protein Q3979_03480 [Actinomycetaceae bacterium]|nr:hypothetical protein [Actinomycetaceae bacterium]